MDTNDNITVIYMDIHIRGEFAYEDENSSFFDSDVIFPKTSQAELFYLFHMRSAAMSAFGASGTGMKATHMPDSYWLSVLPMACQLIMFFPVIIVNYMVNQWYSLLYWGNSCMRVLGSMIYVTMTYSIHVGRQIYFIGLWFLIGRIRVQAGSLVCVMNLCQFSNEILWR